MTTKHQKISKAEVIYIESEYSDLTLVHILEDDIVLIYEGDPRSDPDAIIKLQLEDKEIIRKLGNELLKISKKKKRRKK
jgi:hypothetical protein